MTGLATLTAAVTLCPQGIVNNLVHLVESYGHVPNGIRSYYINRRRAQSVGHRRKGIGRVLRNQKSMLCFTKTRCSLWPPSRLENAAPERT